ncbi:polyketide cyclase/dehydrase/lipid transport protein [Mumia flava]|uniref:Polyketide cyclase/dehydrase/lipid transport protein n=1 Tax=Mumia flava TaxID=1348852 RepID=A0A0B2BKX6_9ACTN|nr:SRPBCC family protein [Mumia flava]PJJ56402.1 polyketide cyclase/dehydrase/lipid transport protein [Mumia flava]
MTAPAIDPYLIEETIEIDAPVPAVWDVVSDLRRMGEWSPQCRRMWVRGPIGVGTRTINLNRQGWKVWPTTARVVRYEPQTAIAFRITENRTVWTFELTDLGDGRTRLVERRTAPHGTSSVSRALVAAVLGGDAAFRDELAQGIASTLARVRTEAEGARR